MSLIEHKSDISELLDMKFSIYVIASRFDVHVSELRRFIVENIGQIEEHKAKPAPIETRTMPPGLRNILNLQNT